MKKLFAIALSVLMIVCAIVPALAATHTTKDGLTIESLVPNAELPEEFVEAGELVPLDYTDDNANLVAGTDYHTYAEDHLYGPAVSVVPGVKYAMTFTVEEAGTYEFCVAHYVRGDDVKAGYPHASSVQIDDGELYSVNEDDLDALTLSAVNYYTGLSVELTAGEHTFYLVGDQSNGINVYFQNVYYYQVGAEDDTDDTTADAGEDTSADAGEDTSADAGEDTSADAGEDTSADAGNDDVAPETFDAAIIALAVAGASAAVAVVSKKRR